LVPLFVATLLLAQSRPQLENQTIVEHAQEMPRPGPVDSVAQLRQELSARPSPRADAAAETTAQYLSPAENPGSDSLNEQVQEPDFKLSDSADVSTAGLAGDAGDAAANTSAVTVRKELKVEQIERFAIQLSSNAQAQQAPGDYDYDDETSQTRVSVVDVLPATPPQQARDRSTLSAAQAAYASRYLSATGDIDD
jgi:hypothetical protein